MSEAKFKTGNVIKTKYGHIVIVTNVNDDYTNYVAFDSENVSGGGKNKKHHRTDMCYCSAQNDGIPDEECEDCKGKGEYRVDIHGMNEATFLASNVKEYILKALTKNFDF